MPQKWILVVGDEILQESNNKGYGGISRSVLNPSKINRLGWKNLFSFGEAIASTIASLKA